MSYMSRNSSANSLMGFSVHQPAIGATLQFFPAMGSQQLDEMINAYVPGEASILDKRAAVSMEFFEHTMATGELFKFFMVYPSLGSTTESPASSSAMLDSGYGSGFNTSPVMSESQWSQSLSSAPKAPSSKKKATAIDFSHLPGMKIMTKDGTDVTNSASRGCKTKEQRDHAHLMRTLKACEACKKKKVKCDPSHKRRSAPSEAKVAKVTKKSKAARPAAAPPQISNEQSMFAPSFDLNMAGSSSSLDSVVSGSSNADANVLMDWEQFVQYDEPTDTIPYDYDFFFDPAGYFSPTASTSSNSVSPPQPMTPVQPIATNTTVAGGLFDETQAPALPYLNPGGLEAGNNYVDFNLYSPGSSVDFDDSDLSFVKEVTAPLPDSSAFRRQRSSDDVHHPQSAYSSQGDAIGSSAIQPDSFAVSDQSSWQSQGDVIPAHGGDHSYYDRSDHRPQQSKPESGSTSLADSAVPDSLHGSGNPFGLRRSTPSSATGLNTVQPVSSEATQAALGVQGSGRSAPVSAVPATGCHAALSNTSDPTQLSSASSGLSSPQASSSASRTGSSGSQTDLELSRSTARPLASTAEAADRHKTSSRREPAEPLLRETPRALTSTANLYDEFQSVRPPNTSILGLQLNISQITADRNTMTSLRAHASGNVEATSSSLPSSLPPALAPESDAGNNGSTVLQTTAPSRKSSSTSTSDVARLPLSAAPQHSTAERNTLWVDSRDAVVDNTLQKIGLLGGVGVSASLSESGQRLSPSALIVAATAVTALGILPLLARRATTTRETAAPKNARSTTQQQTRSSILCWTIAIAMISCLVALALSGLTGEMHLIEGFAGAVAAVAVHRNSYQQTLPCADKLGLSSQPLSFARQMSIATIDKVDSRCSEMSTVFSRVQCVIRRRLSITPSKSNSATKGSPRLRRTPPTTNHTVAA